LGNRRRNENSEANDVPSWYDCLNKWRNVVIDEEEDEDDADCDDEY